MGDYSISEIKKCVDHQAKIYKTGDIHEQIETTLENITKAENITTTDASGNTKTISHHDPVAHYKSKIAKCAGELKRAKEQYAKACKNAKSVYKDYKKLQSMIDKANKGKIKMN